MAGGDLLKIAPFDLDGPALDGLWSEEGFEVTEVLAGQVPAPNPWDFDLVLYVMAEETLLTRGRIFLDWLKLAGGFQYAMTRPWYKRPTALIFFGSRCDLYDAPRMQAVVNGFATMPLMPRAVLDCMSGHTAWNRQRQVNAFCGLPDARFQDTGWA